MDASVDVTSAPSVTTETYFGVGDRSENSLAAGQKEQLILLYRESKTDRYLLSPHSPEEPGAYDDAPTMLALNTQGCRRGQHPGGVGPGFIRVSSASGSVDML